MNAANVTLHERAKALTPDYPTTPDIFWIAVLHSKPRADATVEYDIQWFKCRGHTKADKVKTQYLARFPHIKEIFLRHDGVMVDAAKTMAELNSFGDNIIAIEAIEEPDPLDRTRAPQRDPLQPLSGQKPMNGIVKKETLIKQEPLDLALGNDENRPPLPSPTPSSRLQRAVDSDKKETPARPVGNDHTTIPHEISQANSVQDFMTECALRDFVHERLGALYHSAVALVATVGKLVCPALDNFGQHTHFRQEKHQAEFVIQWHAMPAYAHEMYRKRASHFVNTAASADKSQFQAELDRFTRENAGFYHFLFSKKAVHDRLENVFGPDRAFIMMVDEWDNLSMFVRERFLEEGRRLRYTAPHSIESFNRHTVNSTASRLPPTTTSRNSSNDHCEPHVVQPFRLQKLFENSSPELLEAATEKGVQLLENLKKQLTQTSSDDAAQWLQSIENVQSQAVPARTIVGVVGNTGAGKSSVINAMLDEERLVPTNCMRACTAVVTEISYNHTDDPYRAEIEFITRQNWENELKILFQDLFDGSGNISREATNEESEAGVAYAKIKAVYPKYTRDMLQNSSVDELMKHANVQNVLGGKREIVESDSLRFYKRLQFFVDSKEKTTTEKGKEMEFWPLIKVVRLYVKAVALSTGAVIVDLPGVHDSNAARSAVAEGYMKQCSGLWIVAPINRAVDDKAAKSLLGETFKRQLKMDGGFNTVTFICSKTDDISLMECQESLGLEKEMSALWAKSDEHADQKRKIKRRLDELKETKEAYASTADEVEEQLEVWETLKDDAEDGKTVFAPPSCSATGKRKRSNNEASGPRKKSRSADSDVDSDYAENNENGEDTESGLDEELELQTRGDPLTREQIDEKILELKVMKKDCRRRKLDIDAEIKQLRKQASEIDTAEEKTQAEMSAIAISGRNEYSRSAIQQDFAAGIKELDQELAEEQDAANFDPDVEARDYEEVARSLPVFCVSSRAYQKLQGRLKKEPTVPGFQTVQETEVPQLQTHCKKLTEAGREATCRRFLNSLSQLLNSLRLWSSPDGDGTQLTDRQKEREAQILQNRFKRLDTELEKHIRSVCRQLRTEFEDNIFDAFENAVPAATNEANETVYRWGSPVNRDNRAVGGYFWATYKAICRRDGVYSNAQGPHDWNAELIAPVIKAISSGWEKTFARRVPIILGGFASSAASSMKSFHNDVEAGARRNGGGASPRLQMLSHQLQNYRELFKDLCNANSTTVMAEAKEINRMFQPVIAEAVRPAYEACTAERGTGSFMRMKAHMTAHVDRTRLTMFHESTNKVKRSLEDLIDSVEAKMLARIDEAFLSLKRDYSSALIGSNLAKGSGALPREQRVVREKVLEIVSGSEIIFKRLVGSEPEEEDEQDCDHPEPKLEPADGTCGNSGTLNEQKLLGSPAEGDDSFNIDADGSPFTSKSEVQIDGDSDVDRQV